MYTAERQRAQPYLNQVSGPLYEQWYLLHHRMVRIVTNHPALANQVRHFLYYAEPLSEFTYDNPADLPIDIPEDLLWQAGERLHRPVALTCYLFETRPDEPFPPPPAQPKPEDVQWEEITGVDGPLRARWKEDLFRFREYQPWPGVSSRISSVLHKTDLYATIFIEDVSKCAPWFIMRFVFYMVIGAMLGNNGFEVVHAGAVALDEDGILIVGSPASGKSTLVLGCMQLGMHLLADDVLFLGKDDGIVKVYAFPEDIGIRKGTIEMLGNYEFIQAISHDERQKRFVDVQRFFQGQYKGSCPVRLIVFLNKKQREEQFRAEPLSAAQAVSVLMQEFISHEQAKEGEADFMFDIFSDTAAQAPAYRLFLSPDVHENARQVRDLLERHIVNR
ncbi:MAG TPA: hypothetical protein VFA09_22185 [Ktedonobacteraceae bacterium]|nr:hypothetical protein [Ktedonobacteraceae bacterium]